MFRVLSKEQIQERPEVISFWKDWFMDIYGIYFMFKEKETGTVYIADNVEEMKCITGSE